jgi:hypothetical protein
MKSSTPGILPVLSGVPSILFPKGCRAERAQRNQAAIDRGVHSDGQAREITNAVPNRRRAGRPMFISENARFLLTCTKTCGSIFVRNERVLPTLIRS